MLSREPGFFEFGFSMPAPNIQIDEVTVNA